MPDRILNVNQMPEQVLSKDFKQIFTNVTGFRRGPGHVIITFGHDELMGLNPIKPRIVLDVEIVLTMESIEGLIENLKHHQDNAGLLEK